MSNPIYIRGTRAPELATFYTRAQIIHPTSGNVATAATALNLSVWDVTESNAADLGTAILTDADTDQGGSLGATSGIIEDPITSTWSKDATGPNFTIITDTSAAGSPLTGAYTDLLAEGGQKIKLEFKITVSAPTGIGVVYVVHFVACEEIESE